jgi:hypothetical protein
LNFLGNKDEGIKNLGPHLCYIYKTIICKKKIPQATEINSYEGDIFLILSGHPLKYKGTIILGSRIPKI